MAARRPAPYATGLLAAVLSACSGPGGALAPDAPCDTLRIERSATRANVVLNVNDTMRRDRLGAYGGPAHTPAFDAFAKENLTFIRGGYVHFAGLSRLRSLRSEGTGNTMTPDLEDVQEAKLSGRTPTLADREAAAQVVESAIALPGRRRHRARSRGRRGRNRRRRDRRRRSRRRRERSTDAGKSEKGAILSWRALSAAGEPADVAARERGGRGLTFAAR